MDAKRKTLLAAGFGVIALGISVSPIEIFAWEPTGEIKPRPAADVENPDVTAVYQKLYQAPVVEKADRRAEIRPDSKTVLVERVEDEIDGAVLVSRPIEAGQEAALIAMGVRQAASREELGHHMIFEGRYYRLLTMIPAGPDETMVRAHIGQDMRIESAMRTDSRALLIDLRRL